MTVQKNIEDKLQLTIERLTFLIENSPLAFIEWDEQGYAKSWSRQAEEIFGWTTREFVENRKTGLSQVFEEDKPKIIKIFFDLVSGNVQRNNVQHRMVRKDGEIIWCEWFNSIMKDVDGEGITILSLVQDITDRKKSEEQKEHEERENEALINTSTDMMWSVSSGFRLIAANRAFIQSLEAMVGITIKPGDQILNSDVFPPDLLAHWKESYNKALSGQTFKMETYFPGFAGSAEHWGETSFNPIYKNEKVVAVACYSRDITARKLTEKQIEQRAAELILANKELAFQNEEKERRAAELILANEELVFQNQEKEKRAAELMQAINELAFQNVEKEKRAAELILANKELIFQNEEKEKRAAELILANKELAFQNEEKEKRAAELILANKELAFQNEEKEKRAAELIIANSELSAFTYASSHDLQEPLRKIQTIASNLLDTESSNLSDKGKNYFHHLQDSAKQMQTLISDLLAFSHLNTAVRKFENTDLKTIIDNVRTELQDSLDEKNGRIETPELTCANIIRFQFLQLMRNLIGNAIKYSIPGKPPIIIIKATIVSQEQLNIESLEPGKDYCHISVSDNGIGFEPEYSNRIFEVFQKLHGKEEYAGTGIGLAIVKKIVDNHNGIITATSRLNHGAAFDIYIPFNQ